MNHSETFIFTGNINKIKLTVFTGLLFAIALVLSLIENLFPMIPVAVPGIKFGLSNVAVMYAVFFLGAKSAYMIAVLKSLFVFITRGMIASTLSLAGGLLSITAMLFIIVLLKEKVSYFGISIIGAVSHNIGQFLVVMLFYVSINMWAYLPVLLVFGVIAGILTAALLRIILPAIKRIVQSI